MSAPPLPRPSRQRGAATLITVMVLVLAMSITFAFANRSLIFEQRTSANQVRSTQALEIAEAGLEWALAQLNRPGTVSASPSCAVGASTDPSYSRRYLTVNGTTGAITASAVRSACVIRAGNTLDCTCPATGNPTLTGTGGHFSIQFTTFAARPELVRVTAHGCTSTGTDGTFDSRCLPGGSTTRPSDGYASASILLAQIPAAYPSPKAALSAGGSVDWQGSGASLYIANTDGATNGITISAGGDVEMSSHVNLISVPGTPQGSDPGLSVIGNDTTLSSMTGDQFFLNMMGTSKSDFYNSPKTTRITSTGELSTAAANSRMIWLGPAPGSTAGSFEITGGTYGSTTNPVILVVNGDVNIRGNTTIYGVLYTTASTLDNAGGGNSYMRGAVISEGNYSRSNGSREIIYDSALLSRIWEDPGFSSFVRLPGSWTD